MLAMLRATASAGEHTERGGECAMLLRLFSLPTLALVALVMVGCSLGEEGTGASQKEKAPKGTFELPNGRSLYIECRGSGSPTIVFEVGLEEPLSDVSYVQDTLAQPIYGVQL